MNIRKRRFKQPRRLYDPSFREVVDGLCLKFNQRARGVIFATIAPGIAHVLDFVLVQMAHLMLLGMRTETEFIDAVDDFPEVVAALNPVFQFAENLPDLVLDGVGTFSRGLELFEVGGRVPRSRSRQGRRLSGLCGGPVAVAAFRCRPLIPLIFRSNDVGVGLAGEFRCSIFVSFQVVQVFQEQHPGSLFNIIQFAPTACVFMENIIYIF